MAQTDDSDIPQHKKLAMGMGEASVAQDASGGWPGRCPAETEPALSRGIGRAPDAHKVSAADQPTRAPWMDSAGEGIRVREHVRSPPGKMVGSVG